MTGEPAFTLDRFQREAIQAFDAGESVLVAAPTGSGKTVIAEHGIERMLDAGRTTFYTSPIKALANQKFRDFGAKFGIDQVGLLTGDLSVNGAAPVVVMTTEVLRNMLYERASRLRTLGCVVLDEVHYLQDRHRGPVWEEVLLNLPTDVRTISLSATVSNLDEFVDWLESVRGPTTLVVEHTRPVPLRHLVAAAERETRALHLEPLLSRGRITPEAQRFRDRRTGDGGGSRRGGNGRAGGKDRRHRGGNGRRDSRNQKSRDRGRDRRALRKWAPPRRTQLVRQLSDDGLSPLIWFIFSRAGCDEAVDQLLRSGVRFTDRVQSQRLREILHDRTQDIDDDAWYSLELDDWQRAFERGIASHHAGLIPAVKEAVEVAFVEDLVTVVFATETLALGVNLPARTVVLERMVKYDGEDHKPLTPIEFTQLTGRAGRRGLDSEGTAVSCWNTRLGVDEMAALAASSDFPLRSAFAPNHNMVANLIRRADRDNARRFVARSFAQFQLDRTTMRDESKSVRLERQLASAERATACEHGDVAAWIAAERRQGTADDDELGSLRPGAVLADRGGAIVVSIAHRGGGVVAKLATSRGELVTARAGHLRSPIAQLGVAKLPPGVGPTDPETLRWARTELAENWPSPLTGVATCPDLQRHLDALQEVELIRGRLARERNRLDRRIGRLERRFDAVADILHQEGFADAWVLTDAGQVLTQVHGECEIVLAEVLADGALEHLDAAELAAAVSPLAYEARRGVQIDFRWPNRRVRRAVEDLRRRAERFRSLELAAIDESLTRDPDPTIVPVVYGWATGRSLEEVLPETMTGGDFVRTMRQIIDLCRQIAQTDTPLAETAAEAAFCLDHGVVRTRRDLFIEEAATDDAGELGEAHRQGEDRAGGD